MIEKDGVIEELRKVLKEKNLSPYSAGFILGINNRNLYRWLNHEGGPNPVYASLLRRRLRRLKDYKGGKHG